jgi:hypothetical protein
LVQEGVVHVALVADAGAAVFHLQYHRYPSFHDYQYRLLFSPASSPLASQLYKKDMYYAYPTKD